jgi:guanylate kinase
MAREVADGLFLESAEVHGEYYGMSLKSVKDVAKVRKICIMDIDIQGVQSMKQSALESHFIFIEPP